MYSFWMQYQFSSSLDKFWVGFLSHVHVTCKYLKEDFLWFNLKVKSNKSPQLLKRWIMLIHQIIHHPRDSEVCFVSSYPLDSCLSTLWTTSPWPQDQVIPFKPLNSDSVSLHPAARCILNGYPKLNTGGCYAKEGRDNKLAAWLKHRF